MSSARRVDSSTVTTLATTATQPESAPRQRLLSLVSAQVSSASDDLLLNVPTLDVYRGERVVITGLSGSGKSMLLATMAGRWDTGLQFVGQRDANFDRVGFIPQRGLDALHPLTRLDRQLRQVTRQPASRVREMLAAVGLTDPQLQRRRPTELSGGQAQRAAIALAVLSDSALILADEPTSALDHETRDQTLRLLDRVIDDRRTLVVATHDLAVVSALATRHFVVKAGKPTEIPVQRPGQAA